MDRFPPPPHYLPTTCSPPPLRRPSPGDVGLLRRILGQPLPAVERLPDAVVRARVGRRGAPLVPDLVEHALPAGAHELEVRRRHREVLAGLAVEEARVRRGAVDARERVRVARVLVARGLGLEAPHVGADVVPPEVRQAPVVLDRREDAVVRVEGVVLGALELRGHGAAEEQRRDLVGLRVVVGLVVREVDQRAPVGEPRGAAGSGLALEERLEEGVRPRGGVGERGVVPVVEHVGRHEDELRHGGSGQIVCEVVEGAEGPEACAVLDYGVEGDEGAAEWVMLVSCSSATTLEIQGRTERQVLVLPDVVPCASRALPVARDAHETGPGLVLKVAAKGNALGVQHVDDSGYVVGDVYGVVMVQAEVVAADGCDIVRLGGVRLGVVLGEQDPLPLEIGDVRIEDDLGVVLCCCSRPSPQRSVKSTTTVEEGKKKQGENNAPDSRAIW